MKAIDDNLKQLGIDLYSDEFNLGSRQTSQESINTIKQLANQERQLAEEYFDHDINIYANMNKKDYLKSIEHYREKLKKIGGDGQKLREYFSRNCDTNIFKRDCKYQNDNASCGSIYDIKTINENNDLYEKGVEHWTWPEVISWLLINSGMTNNNKFSNFAKIFYNSNFEINGRELTCLDENQIKLLVEQVYPNNENINDTDIKNMMHYLRKETIGIWYKNIYRSYWNDILAISNKNIKDCDCDITYLIACDIVKIFNLLRCHDKPEKQLLGCWKPNAIFVSQIDDECAYKLFSSSTVKEEGKLKRLFDRFYGKDKDCLQAQPCSGPVFESQSNSQRVRAATLTTYETDNDYDSDHEALIVYDSDVIITPVKDNNNNERNVKIRQKKQFKNKKKNKKNANKNRNKNKNTNKNSKQTSSVIVTEYQNQSQNKPKASSFHGQESTPYSTDSDYDDDDDDESKTNININGGSKRCVHASGNGNYSYNTNNYNSNHKRDEENVQTMPADMQHYLSKLSTIANGAPTPETTTPSLKSCRSSQATLEITTTIATTQIESSNGSNSQTLTNVNLNNATDKEIRIKPSRVPLMKSEIDVLHKNINKNVSFCDADHTPVGNGAIPRRIPLMETELQLRVLKEAKEEKKKKDTYEVEDSKYNSNDHLDEEDRKTELELKKNIIIIDDDDDTDGKDKTSYNNAHENLAQSHAQSRGHIVDELQMQPHAISKCNCTCNHNMYITQEKISEWKLACCSFCGVTIALVFIGIYFWYNCSYYVSLAMNTTLSSINEHVIESFEYEFYIPQTILQIVIGGLSTHDIPTDKSIIDGRYDKYFASFLSTIDDSYQNNYGIDGSTTNTVFLYNVDEHVLIGASRLKNVYDQLNDDDLVIFYYNQSCVIDVYYDPIIKSRNETASALDTYCDYNPKERPWYKIVPDVSSMQQWTEPYLFPTNVTIIGTSLAQKIVFEHDGKNTTFVVVVDFTVSSLQSLINKFNLPLNGMLYIVTQNFSLIASDTDDEKWVKYIKNEYENYKNVTGDVIMDINPWLASITSFEMIRGTWEYNYTNMQPGFIIIVYDDSFISPLYYAAGITGGVWLIAVIALCSIYLCECKQFNINHKGDMDLYHKVTCSQITVSCVVLVIYCLWTLVAYFTNEQLLNQTMMKQEHLQIMTKANHLFDTSKMTLDIIQQRFANGDFEFGYNENNSFDFVNYLDYDRFLINLRNANQAASDNNNNSDDDVEQKFRHHGLYVSFANGLFAGVFSNDSNTLMSARSQRTEWRYTKWSIKIDNTSNTSYTGATKVFTRNKDEIARINDEYDPR